MNPPDAHRSNWHRATVGLLAVASWAAAAALFAGYGVAMRRALETESYLLGGAGWLFGLLAFYLVAKIVRQGEDADNDEGDPRQRDDARTPTPRRSGPRESAHRGESPGD